MKKNRALIFAIALIVIGSFLEIFYYKVRFEQDGIVTWLSIIIGAALTLLLTLVVYIRKKPIAWLIIIPLAIYSILATSAGQSFSLSKLQKEEAAIETVEAYTQDEITEARERIKYLDEQIIIINNQISGTVITLEDRFNWKNTLAAAQEQIKNYTEERAALAEKLSSLRSTAVTHEEVETVTTNIYKFYHNLTGVPASTLQFILQTLLSAFIAAMSPIGIITLSGGRVHEKRAYVKHERTDEISDSDVLRWIRINWMGKRTGRSETILPKKVFTDFIAKNNERFSDKKYNKLLAIARELHILEGDIIKADEELARKKIIDRLKNA